jgi:catechol 2,3-dioxygenase-like lactoylglutathione lyase family enzyme
MPERALPTLTTINICASDPARLAAFYARLLAWEIAVQEPEWVLLRNPAGGVGISVQSESPYVAPVWPTRPGEQQMMMHLELRVEDLAHAAAHAEACGATLAPEQPQDDVRVYLDPDGHPFCLWVET